MSKTMNVLQKKTAVIRIEGMLYHIRQKDVFFFGIEGPCVIAAQSAELSFHPDIGNYFPMVETSCRVATVSEVRHIVTEHGVLARPAKRGDRQIWSKDGASALYLPIGHDELQKLDLELLRDIIVGIGMVVKDTDPC